MNQSMDNECAICFSEYSNKKQLSKCAHCFCTNCIYQWISSKPNCPICRTNVSTLEKWHAKNWKRCIIKKIKCVYSLNDYNISREERKTFLEYLGRNHVNTYFHEEEWKQIKGYISFNDNIKNIFEKMSLDTKVSYSKSIHPNPKNYENIYYKIRY